MASTLDPFDIPCREIVPQMLNGGLRKLHFSSLFVEGVQAKLEDFVDVPLHLFR